MPKKYKSINYIKMEFYEPGYNYEDDEILPELKREDYVIKQIREEASIKEKPI